MSALLLSVRDIHVAYGSVEAVSGVSISAKAGSIVTVIGANGALTGYAGGVERKRWLLTHEQQVLLHRP